MRRDTNRFRVGACRWLAAGSAAACFLLIIGNPALAEGPRPITLEEAVEIALAQNTSLMRSENQTLLNDVAVSDAKMRFFPDLGLGLTTSGNYSRLFDEMEREWSGESSESIGARLSTSVVLFDGLGNIANLKGARLGRSAELLDMKRTRQTVIFYVISGFIDMIEAEELTRVREENLSAQEDLENQIRALVEGGERPVSDIYQQQSNVANARLTLVEAERTLALARIDLVQALQLDPAEEYLFEAPQMTDPSLADETPGVSTIIEKAFRNRTDLLALEERVAAGEQNRRAASAGYWPSLSLSAGYGANYMSTADFGIGEQLEERRSGDIQLSLSVPIFDRFETRSDVDRAEIAIDNARLSLIDLRQDVALQVRRAILDREAARERLSAAEAQELASRMALDFTRQRYDAGVATLYEVTLSRADYVEASSNVVSASYNLLWQDRLIDYYTGVLDSEAGLAQ